jgi:hypothetical protein
LTHSDWRAAAGRAVAEAGADLALFGRDAAALTYRMARRRCFDSPP